MAGDAPHRKFAAWTVQSEFPLPELPMSAAARDWTLGRDPSAARRDHVHWYAHADAADGLPWVWFGRRLDADIIRFPGLGWCRFDGSDRIACAWRKHLGDQERQHLLVNHVLPLAASRAGALVLHASVVVRPGGGAVAFTGPVGAGKSTTALALASRGWRLFSDDRLIIGDDRNAHPIAPYLRVAPTAAAQFDHHALLPEGHHKVRLRADQQRLCWHDGPVALERIVFIETTDGGTDVSALTGRDASIAVLTSLLQLGLDRPAVRRRVFERVGALIGAVPITKLRMAKRWERLTEIEAALRGA